MHRVNALAPLQLADRHAGQLGVAAPFALAGEDEVEVEPIYKWESEDEQH